MRYDCFCTLDSILNFEDLKKENKKFTSLRKEFPQRHDAFDLEDSDDSHASVNQEKLAYEARVRSYTRAPPVPEAKTSLNSIDIARINNFANDGYPQLSAGCHQPEGIKTCVHKHMELAEQLVHWASKLASRARCSTKSFP